MEYRIDIKVRNNLILKKIGNTSIPKWCKKNGISYVRLLDFINMKESIYDSKRQLRPLIDKLCKLLLCSVEDLFTPEQMEANLATNKRSIEVNKAEMQFMLDQTDSQKTLEQTVADEQMADCVSSILDNLSERERDILQMRFSLGDYHREYLLPEIGEKYGITGERVKQIQNVAIRKLRNPGRTLDLIQYLEN